MRIVFVQNVIASGFDCPPKGAVRDVPEDFARHLIEIGAAIAHETRVEQPPVEVKKKAPSESAPAVRAPARKTPKRSRKSVPKR